MTLVVFFFLIECVILFGIRGPAKMVAIVYLISNCYFSILGTYYWTYFEGGVFLGQNWTVEIANAAIIYQVAAVTFLLALLLGSRLWQVKNEFRSIAPGEIERLNIALRPLIYFILLGVICSLYVYGATESGIGRDGFFLIAYQLSDVLIPSCLLMIASRNLRAAGLAVLIYFCLFALYAGFRYKLALCLGPLLFWLILTAPVYRKLLYVILAIIVVSVFAILTLARQKFGGLSVDPVDLIKSINYEQLAYAFMAESNILFGLIGLLGTYVTPEIYVGFDPLVDSVLELVPRAIYGEKNTAAYYQGVLEGLYSFEALASGTAYPYFGEYLLMGGYPAMFFGCTFLGLASAFFLSRLSRIARSEAFAWHAFLLVAFFVGYFYFSRGQLPSVVKISIVVFIPLILILRSRRRSKRERFTQETR
jgi:hypothetical protein